jgi:Zn-dependent peptidase ImmA (M78 family)
MDIRARVGLADPIEAMKHQVDSLLDAAEIFEPPVDIELLASMSRVRRIELLEMAEAGRLVPHEGAYVVHVNQRHPETKQRFTVAHEVGHTFFDAASRSPRGLTDPATGLFDLRNEEEYLCDIGAAHTLLNRRWLEPLAREVRPSLDGLIDLAGTCRASLEATAIQLSQLGLWYCTFAFLEPGLRKAERLAAGQAALPGWGDVAGPVEKLRVRRVYGPPGVPFLPLNKSVPASSQIWRAYDEQTRTEGEELLDLGHSVMRAYTQSIYAPYYDETGTQRHRVIACVVWERGRSGRGPTPRSRP